MKTIHIYIGWKVTLQNGNEVHFTDQKEALKYFGDKAAREMVMTREEIQCGLERGRKFCGHCKKATQTIRR